MLNRHDHQATSTKWQTKDESPLRQELTFERALVRLVGLPYLFGGRGYGGVDCSSLIVQGIRRAARKTVAQLPWMTADQLAKGMHKLTREICDLETHNQCVLAFFDWDEDGIYEHSAVRFLDWTWIWSSSTAGRVVRVDPLSETLLRRQWLEICDTLMTENCVLRIVNWDAARQR